MKTAAPVHVRVLKAAAKRFGLQLEELEHVSRRPAVLHARNWAAMTMSDKHGLSYREIARRMNCSLRTSIDSAARGRRAKRAVWNKGKAMRTLTPEELERAIDINHRQRRGVNCVCEALGCGVETLSRAFRAAGLELRPGKPGGRPGVAVGKGDPLAGAPIGTVPPGHPLYAVDQAILRARTMKYRAEGGWRQSSTALAMELGE